MRFPGLAALDSMAPVMTDLLWGREGQKERQKGERERKISLVSGAQKSSYRTMYRRLEPPSHNT